MFYNTKDLNKYIEDLTYLVAIDSPTNYVDGIRQVAQFLAEKVAHLPVKVSFIEGQKDSGPCLLITNAEANEDFDILLLAHMDTVYPIGTADNRRLRIEGNKVYGPGVIDDKGCALMGIYALNYLRLDTFKFAYFLNSNEEVGSPGNADLIKELATRAKYCFTLEAAREDGSLVDKRYGYINYKIHFKGIPATMKNFKEGSSALLQCANFIKQVDILNSHYKGSLVNCVILEGGLPNLAMVPDHIVLGLQMRFLDKDSLTLLQSKIEAFKESLTAGKVELTAEIVGFFPALVLNANSKMMKRHLEFVGRNLGIEIKWQASHGGSDGCFASDVGCAVIDGMGPIGGAFHTENEYLDLNSVEPRCNLLIEIINKLVKIKTLPSVIPVLPYRQEYNKENKNGQ
ncbi:M20 family metallopeptidase [Candidatus Hepatincolaceae symbiont of Richtersius coronifer]